MLHNTMQLPVLKILRMTCKLEKLFLLSLFFLATTVFIYLSSTKFILKSRSAKELHLTTWEVNSTGSVKNLPEQVSNGIKYFVFFLGCDRSGSSILGSLMDAHPHAIIANEWRFPMFTDKSSSPSLRKDLFNKLYSASAKNKVKKRSHSDKGYTLVVDGLWQGAYDEYIEIIGDKTSGFDVIPFLRSKRKFRKNYEVLKNHLNIPIRAIQAVRNPFDVIATGAIIKALGNEKFRDLKLKVRQNKTGGKLNAPRHVEQEINYVFDMYTSARDIKYIMGWENVLDVHNVDLVDDPRRTISRIFKFLGVETTEQYLDMCANKVFKSESQSRNLVLWTLKQIEQVETRMREFRVLDRYNFTSY